MKKDRIIFSELGVVVELSCFEDKDARREIHVLLHVEPRGELFSGQLARITAAEQALLALPQCAGMNVVAGRYFLSDATNQRPLIQRADEAAVCYIQQPPLDGSKVAVWLYLLQDVQVAKREALTVVQRGAYQDLWLMGMTVPEGDSAAQTESLLTRYEKMLAQQDATLADNCIRTWFHVRDVDTQYAGMVRARRENFVLQGLTQQTHYISSTGIGGLPADTKAIVQLGAYAIKGLAPQQQRYLYAKSHLNSTIEYGVTFERGTVVDYGDRSHLFISGTASINNRGEVMYAGDIVAQTERMWENVETLLAEGGASFDDVAHMIVYLRDVSDYETVREKYARRFPDVPCVFTLAPVCRPAWLIEMECMAIRKNQDSRWDVF